MQGRICKERYGSNNVRMRYCHCDNQDGCNSAPALLTSSRGLSGQTLTLAAVTLLAVAVPEVMLLVGQEVRM